MAALRPTKIINRVVKRSKACASSRRRKAYHQWTSAAGLKKTIKKVGNMRVKARVSGEPLNGVVGAYSLARCLIILWQSGQKNIHKLDQMLSASWP